jgi:streptomycin 6-kinase
MAAHDDERAVLVHGDVHEWNALQAPGGGFKLVDPDGLVAEPEYDLGVLMREDRGPPDARRRRPPGTGSG